MIRKLKIKFVAINMMIVTIMLMVILGMVYHSMKRNLEEESVAMMKSIAANPMRLGFLGEISDEVRLPYFALSFGPRGEILSTGGGYYDLSDEALLQIMLNLTVQSNTQVGVLEDYNLRYCRIVTPLNQMVVFADMSSEQATLRNLMQNCMLIGIVSFISFLVISFGLAQWAVRPVDRAWKLQKQFVADASHELKTPLTVITTNAELLQSSDYDAPSKERFLDAILDVSQHMRVLLEQMLQLAKSDSEQNKLATEIVDFSKLVTETAYTYEAVLYEQELSLTYDIESDCHVCGELHLLAQVLDILLDNAGKYSKVNGNVEVKLKKVKRNKCLLTVASEGALISKDNLKKIFERFYRVDEARANDGSFGLGLSIAKNIISIHKGKIWATSQNGVNTFFVELQILKNEKSKQ